MLEPGEHLPSSSAQAALPSLRTTTPEHFIDIAGRSRRTQTSEMAPPKDDGEQSARGDESTASQRPQQPVPASPTDARNQQSRSGNAVQDSEGVFASSFQSTETIRHRREDTPQGYGKFPPQMDGMSRARKRSNSCRIYISCANACIKDRSNPF